MGHQSSEKSTIPAKIFYFIVLAGTCYFFFYKGKTMSDFLENTFQITEFEFSLIPLGVLLFFSFWKFNEKVFVKPYLEMYKKREELTSLVGDKHTEIMSEVDQLKETINSKKNEKTKNCLIKKEEELKNARKKASDIIHLAQEKSKKLKEQNNAKNVTDFNKSKEQVKKDLDKLVDLLADKITQTPEKTIRIN